MSIPEDLFGRIKYFGYCNVKAGEYSDEWLKEHNLLVDRLGGRWDVVYPDTKENRANQAFNREKSKRK